MLKLIKYEFRKTLFSKLILLFVTAAAEIAYLIGVFTEWERPLMIGLSGLMFSGIIGVFYIGIESLISFHRDLNTKQSYMLFLTPHNSFEVLGAKVIENGCSIFLTGLFFLVLMAIDGSIMLLHVGGIKEFLRMLDQLLRSFNIVVEIRFIDALEILLSSLASWLMTVVTGYFAIVLSATVLAGKRFSGFVSFLLFMLIQWASAWLLAKISAIGAAEIPMLLVIAAALALTAAMYTLTGWIMERRLSV